MSETNDGGPAFPVIEMVECVGDDLHIDSLCGLSVRDWFAGMALQGMLSSRILEDHMEAGAPDIPTAFRRTVRDSYMIADEMLKAREA